VPRLEVPCDGGASWRDVPPITQCKMTNHNHTPEVGWSRALGTLPQIPYCQYPVDWVPPRTCFRPSQKARHAPMRCHVPPRHRNPPPCLGRAPELPRVQGFGPRPSPRRAPVLPCALMLRTPPHHPGGVRHCHVSLGIGPRLTSNEGSSADNRPSAPDRTHLRVGLRC
jgi:hypothetical protein